MEDSFKRNVERRLIKMLFNTLPKTYGKGWINFRKKIHPFIVREFEKTLPKDIHVYKNEYFPNGKPTIFVVTHVFYDDIAAVSCALKENSFLVTDTFSKESISLLDGIGLYLKGTIELNKSKDVTKEEKQEFSDQALKLLGNGADLLLFSESTYNFRPNQLVRDHLPFGALRLAEPHDCNVVPVAVDIVKGQYAVNIGKIFERKNDLIEDIEILRDEMATLVWQLYELKRPVLREGILPDELDWYFEIQHRCNGRVFDFELEEDCAFRKKDENGNEQVSLDEVVASLYNHKATPMSVDYDNYLEVKKLTRKFNYNPRIRK